MNNILAAIIISATMIGCTFEIVNAIVKPQPPHIGVCNDSSPNGETRYCVFKDSPNYDVKRAVYSGAPIITKQSNFSM